MNTSITPLEQLDTPLDEKTIKEFQANLRKTLALVQVFLDLNGVKPKNK